jgi:hypothetical protein
MLERRAACKAKQINGNGFGLTLQQAVAVRMWPTPHGFSPDGRSNGPSGNELGRAVNQSLWPTPTSRDWKDGTAQACRNVPVNALLGRAVHLWPTPKAADGERGGRGDLLAWVRGYDNSHYPTPTSSRRSGLQSHGKNAILGSLNPTWVEWLMGYPLGWTASKD